MMNRNSALPPRRALRASITSLWLVISVGSRLDALSDEPVAQTYTFKTVPELTNGLQADVHRPSGDTNTIRPVVVFIHGGALMMGDRKLTSRPGSLLKALLDGGYVVVSIDYRLAPQVKLPAIIEDLRDACNWVRKRGPA